MSWYADHDVEVHTSAEVVAVDAASKTISTACGLEQHYDKLVLAVGSSAFVPPIKGTDARGVFVYRDISDLDALLSRSRQTGVESACVLGGGLLGLARNDGVAALHGTS